MKISNTIAIIILCIALMANKCYKKSDIENRITVVNKLDKAIYVVPGFNYPDTSLNCISKEMILANSNSFLVNQKTESRISNLSLCYKSEWERVFVSFTPKLTALAEARARKRFSMGTASVYCRSFLKWKSLKAT